MIEEKRRVLRGHLEPEGELGVTANRRMRFVLGVMEMS